MKEAKVEVTIAGKRLEVPPYKDYKTTQKLAKLLEKRLKTIEADSPRIDTHAFALEAALSFAAELADAEETLESESTQLYNHLDDLSKTLTKLVRQYQPND